VSTYSVPLTVPGAVVTPWFCVVVVLLVTVRPGLVPVEGVTKTSPEGSVKVTRYPLPGGTSLNW
jgi:hypothetical protein